VAYLASEAVAVENLHTEAYRAFLEEDAVRRQGYVRRAKGKIGQRLLEKFDQEEARLLRFAESFRHHPERPVLDFWKWDSQMNPQPFVPPSSNQA